MPITSVLSSLSNWQQSTANQIWRHRDLGWDELQPVAIGNSKLTVVTVASTAQHVVAMATHVRHAAVAMEMRERLRRFYQLQQTSSHHGTCRVAQNSTSVSINHTQPVPLSERGKVDIHFLFLTFEYNWSKSITIHSLSELRSYVPPDKK